MNLKKMILSAACVLASATGFSATYAVWPAATDGEIQIPNEFNYWWNLTARETDGSMKCFATDKGTDCSSGWMTSAASGFDFKALADLDLTFNVKVEGTGKWNIRITAADGVESDVTLPVAADGEFHKMRYNIAQSWPAVATKWKNGGANGKDIFTFSVVGSGLSADAALYFNGVRYVDAVAQPALTAEATDITATSARLAWNVVFPEGYTDTQVTVNGEPAAGNEMLLNNLTPKTKYSYTIEAKGKFGGETFTASKIVEFTTSREAGKNPVWYGTTDIPGFSAEYSITYNSDKTLTVDAVFEAEKETVAADRNFHIYVGGDEWLKLQETEPGVLNGTTAKTYEEGTTITWEWYFPYAGGVYQQMNTYVIGSENEAPLSISVKAEARNITFNSAEISYTVKAPADAKYKVYYKAAEGEAKEAAESPVKLTGLTESTEYSYEVYAILGEGENAVESRHATVTFKTTAENAVAHIYSDLTNAEFKNAYLIGEEESMRRSFFVSIPWSVVYDTDGTAVYSADLSAVKNIVGMNPQIYWNGFKQLTINDATGRYEYKFGAQELDAETAISHYFAYNGGTVDIRTPYTKWGMEKEAPVIGNAADLTLAASKTMVKIGEPVILSVVAKDANGYYLPADGVDFSVDGEGYSLEGSIFTITTGKGKRTVKATSGELTASAEITAMASSISENILAGKIGVTNNDCIQGGEVKNVTDEDRNSQLEWKCGDTQEHYLVYDLGDDYYIEAIDLLFEGAYATKFTVTLSNTAPAELGVNGISTLDASSEKVFNNEKNDTQHYFMQDPEGTHRYVALRTSEALNTGWGIKVRDLKVYGSKTNPVVSTGVEEIDADNSDAPVEIYNLNGQRVVNPEQGIYILRQGKKVSKVVIR